MATFPFAEIVLQAFSIALITPSRRSKSVSRMSALRRTRLGILLTAPGNTSQIPTVATVSTAPLLRAALSIARISSAAAQRASRRSGIRTPPACPPAPSIAIAQAGRSGNARHDSERRPLTFQYRALFDVQLNERLVVGVRQLHFVEMSAHPRVTADIVDRFSVAIG